VGLRYLHAVAPAYGFLGFGLALYFASQGAKRMGWAMTAGIGRLAVVAGLGSLVMHGSRTADTSLTPFLGVLVLALVVYAAINVVPWLARNGTGQAPVWAATIPPGLPASPRSSQRSAGESA
jgi:hypothetical protein